MKSLAIAFSIPKSRLVQVKFIRPDSPGVTYAATIPNPVNNSGLEIAMLNRKVSMRQIKSVELIAEHASPIKGETWEARFPQFAPTASRRHD